MGRNKRMGLDYFPFDVDFFQDIKIRKLIKRQGGKAVTVYALLLCYIYKCGYYMRWDEELPFIVSEQTGFDEAYIQEVINSCLSLGLFSAELHAEDGVLTSKGIQERYQKICTDCRRVCEIREYSLISSEEKGISSEEMPISSEEMGINSEETPISSEKSTQSKVNKRKENNNNNNNKTTKHACALLEMELKDFCDYFVKYWNSQLKVYRSSMRPIRTMTAERSHLIGHLRSYSREQITIFCANAMQSPYLNGRVKGRTKPAEIDWILADDRRICQIIENNL